MFNLYESIRYKYLYQLYTPIDPRIIIQMPSGTQVLEEAKSIAREVGMSEEEIDSIIREANV